MSAWVSTSCARQPTPEVIAGLSDEVMQLSRLVNDLHTLSVADVDGLRCEFTEGDANALLLRVVQRFEAQTRARGLRLEIIGQPAGALAARWDFGRMAQMISNLLANSISLGRPVPAGGAAIASRQGSAMINPSASPTLPTPRQTPIPAPMAWRLRTG